MGYRPFRYAIFIVIVLLTANWAFADEITSEVSIMVENLGPNTLPRDLKQLRKDPHLAARLLVTQLKPVSEVEIWPGEKEKHHDAMKVLWSIRSLRYLTGQDFLAETKHRFGHGKTDDTRNQMLHHHAGAKNRVTFFGVWMSRDCVYFAPADAQKKIIAKWKEWLEDNGDTFVPAEEAGVSEWYF